MTPTLYVLLSLAAFLIMVMTWVLTAMLLDEFLPNISPAWHNTLILVGGLLCPLTLTLGFLGILIEAVGDVAKSCFK